MNFEGRSWLRYLPASMQSRIKNSPGLQNVLTNTGWLFAGNALRLSVGLLVGVWLARYLGPAQFGLLSYAMAFVSLFGVIATLGLDGIVVRDLVKEPETAKATLGTAFILQLIGGLLAFGITVVAIDFVRSDDTQAKLMVVVLGSAMAFKASEVVKYWFESQVQSKYTVWVESVVFLSFATVKIVLILGHAPLLAFVWAVFAEALVVAVAFLGVYAWRGGPLRAWQGQSQRAQNLLRDSWPLILSGLAVMVYMRIDQVMLGQLLGDKAVGIYSAAVRISEVWYFLPLTICASVFPAILEAKKKNVKLYYQRLQELFNLMVLLSLMIALPLTFFSNWLIHTLYDQSYIEAAGVLAIHIWAGIFVFLGVAGSKWFIAENLQRFFFYRTFLGALLNVVLNFILIPKYGLNGAAWATVTSQAMASVFFNLFSSETRILYSLQIKSILGVNLFRK